MAADLASIRVRARTVGSGSTSPPRPPTTRSSRSTARSTAPYSQRRRSWCSTRTSIRTRSISSSRASTSFASGSALGLDQHPDQRRSRLPQGWRERLTYALLQAADLERSPGFGGAVVARALARRQGRIPVLEDGRRLDLPAPRFTQWGLKSCAVRELTRYRRAIRGQRCVPGWPATAHGSAVAANRAIEAQAAAAGARIGESYRLPKYCRPR